MSACWGDGFPDQCEGLSPTAVRVVALAIADVVNDTYDWTFFGSLPRLGRKVGVHRNTVRLVVAHLVATGVVELIEAAPGEVRKYRWLLGRPRVNHAWSDDRTPRESRVPPRDVPRTPARRHAPIPREPQADTSPLGQLPLTGGDLNIEFFRWWAVWPRRVARIAALKAYTKARKTASAEQLLAGANTVLAAWNAEPDRRQFVPHPASWLNDGRWLDEVVPSEAVKPTGPVWTADPACEHCAGDGWRPVEEGSNTLEPCPCRK